MVTEPEPQLLPSEIAHDFNNLLASILGHALYIQSLTTPGDEIHESARAVERAVDRGAALTARIAGAPVAVVELVDIHYIIGEVALLLRQGARSAPRICCVLQAQSPTIQGDATLLLQMLLNLGVNARDAMPGGGTLTFETMDAADEIGVTVSDTGCGIPPEMHQLVFLPAITTKRRGVGEGMGMGMGLAIVRHVVDRHRGSIRLESEPGKGATFHIRLPRRLE